MKNDTGKRGNIKPRPNTTTEKTKDEDILSPDCRREKKNELTINAKKIIDDGLVIYCTVSSLKAVCHRYILFVSMVSSVLSRLQSGLSYLGPQ